MLDYETSFNWKMVSRMVAWVNYNMLTVILHSEVI